jgi:anhydro-N-acetylmuramic acid kinase
VKNAYYVGVMTGTSLDAADAVLVDFDNGSCRIIADAQVLIPLKQADEWRQLATDDATLAQALTAANAVAKLCAKAVAALGAPPDNIVAIGCHGQTVLHRPAHGWSAQLLNGALLAELCGADVVCDFRSRDIAAGGQGAPLAPLFHRAAFATYKPCAIINLGGIANISVLDTDGGVRGWDTGPANMLMDAWYRRHQSGQFDFDGSWATSGTIVPSLLQTLLEHPFLALSSPKSCGREEFDLRHFENELAHHRPEDAQATLLEWSAQTVTIAVRDSNVPVVFLCGGGAHNTALTNRLKTLLPDCNVQLSNAAGLPAERVEATAFAWFAKQFIEGKALDISSITGARGARILGAHYPR